MASRHSLGGQLAADLAMPVGSLVSILLASGLVAVRGERWRWLAMVALMAPVAAATLLGGLRSGIPSAVVAALSFNFFHLVPYGVLKLGVEEWAWGLVFVLPALLQPVKAPDDPHHCGRNHSHYYGTDHSHYHGTERSAR